MVSTASKSENWRLCHYLTVEPGLKGHPAPRGLWQHAVVMKTFPGNDGLVRKAELKLSGQRILTRPIHKLCLIATSEKLNYSNE